MRNEGIHGEIVDALAGPGYVAVTGYAGVENVLALLASLDTRQQAGRFHHAGIGVGAARALAPAIRGDRISWIDGPEDCAEEAFLTRLDGLRVSSNHGLMMGLEALDMHFASFAPGAGYVRHLDRSPTGVDLVVSVIYYLNQDWQAGDGGELEIETANGLVLVEPRADTLVVFLSAQFSHTVLPAVRERCSLAGWFHRRPLGRPS